MSQTHLIPPYITTYKSVKKTTNFIYHDITIYVPTRNKPLNSIYIPHMPINSCKHMKQLAVNILHMNNAIKIVTISPGMNTFHITDINP